MLIIFCITLSTIMLCYSCYQLGYLACEKKHFAKYTKMCKEHDEMMYHCKLQTDMLANKMDDENILFITGRN